MPSFSGSFNIYFQNTYSVYERHVICSINEKEYNLSYNPSLLIDPTNLSSSLQDFATASFFSPYATTIGLYNDDNELLMVSKFPHPILISNITDMNFDIKFDV